MSKQETSTKKKINWSAIKTNVIVAFIAITIGLIGGYFTSINVREDARANVVKDISVVTSVAQSKDQK